MKFKMADGWQLAAGGFGLLVTDIANNDPPTTSDTLFRMSFVGVVSIISLVWFVGGALWLLIAPGGFVRFASRGTRPNLTPAQLRRARILGCVGLIIGAVIIFEFKYGLIR